MDQKNFYLFELAMAFSNQIFIYMGNRDELFGYQRRKEEAKYLYILFILGKKNEMTNFLEYRNTPDWFGKFASLMQKILIDEVPPEDVAASVNFQAMLTEFGSIVELKYLLDVIFGIPDNLCLWTISSLDLELVAEIGKIGRWFRNLLKKNW